MTELTDLSDIDAENTLVTGEPISGGTFMSRTDNVWYAVLGLLSRFRNSNVFRLRDNTDKTKQLAFLLSSITTSTTRTLTVPDKSGTLALTSDLPATPAWERIGNPVSLGVDTAFIDFTGLGAFRELRVTGRMRGVVNGGALFLRLGAGTVASGGSDYQTQLLSGFLTTTSASESTTSGYIVATNTGNGANSDVQFTMEISGFNKNVRPNIKSHANLVASDGTRVTTVNGGARLANVTGDTIRLIHTLGNLAAGGYAVLEGIRG